MVGAGQQLAGAASSNSSSIEVQAITSPQVCGNCEVAKSSCLRTQSLRRKAKPRRYVEPNDEIIRKLKAEVQSLRTQIQVGDRSEPRGQESPSLSAVTQARQHGGYDEAFASPRSTSTSRQKQVRQIQTDQGSDYVFKHMGRLVHTTSGVGRFAGSTTGIHFIHSAEQKYIQIFNAATGFDRSVYALHTLPQPMSLHSRSQFSGNKIQHRPPNLGLAEPKSFYLSKVERFFKRWGSKYPILSLKQFYEGAHQIFDHNHESISQMSNSKFSTLHQLYLILAINAWDNAALDNDLQTDNAPYYFELALQTHIRSVEQGDLSTLQSLLLMSLFWQLSGQHARLTLVNGETVRLAHLLGLHRHSRRFKFCAGEVEMRNRVWWAVYRLDTIVSLSYGLPTTIKDSDIDTELPLDCDFDDINLTTLPFPLPGETTRVSVFLFEVRLIHIISSCLQQLYTTTERKGGLDKIAILDREIHVWEDNFNPAEKAFNRVYEDGDFTILHLRLMSNVCKFLVHLPALTFDPETPQFWQSLDTCVRSCRSIIDVFDNNSTERRLFYLQPSGARLVFQSALMCLYGSWHTKATEELNHTAQEQSRIAMPDAALNETISSAVGLLEIQATECLRTDLSGPQGQSWTSSEIFRAAVSTLNDLAANTTQKPRDFRIADISTTPDSPVAENSQEQTLSASTQSWRLCPSALDGLNQLDAIEQEFVADPLDHSVMDSNFFDASMLL